jgi:hypothetical protein
MPQPGMIDPRPPPYDEGRLPCGLDTYDVKMVNYVDRVTGLPTGTPTGHVYEAIGPMMYTHPGWPCRR